MTRALSVSLLCLAATSAQGFQIDSAISRGCHEKMAAAAAADSPWPNGAQPPAPTDAVRALAGDVEFTVPKDADAWTLGLLLGVRDNDLQGAGTLDLPDLAAVHNGLADQDAHCLRADTDDGPEGDVKALAACRAFALKHVELALGDGDQPDLDATVTVEIALRFERGQFQVPRYAFYLGKAMHSVQDGFSHTFRTPSYARVESVLNWIDPAIGTNYLASRDGYAHLSTLDHCVPDAADLAAGTDVAGRVDAATQASRTLFQTVSAAPDRASRLAAVNALFDQWFQYEPGCDESNEWCGNVKPAKGGCSSAGGGTLLPLLAVAALAFRRRVRRRRPAPGCLESSRLAGGVSLAALGAAALLCFGAPARAEAPAPATPAEPAPASAEPAPAAATAAPAKAEAPPASEVMVPIHHEPARRWSLHGTLGVSLDRGGGNLAVGAGLALARFVRLRADLEWNPWFDSVSGVFAAGAMNAYLTFMMTWIHVGPIELSTSVSLGTSVLLFHPAGATPGSVGVYLGASALRLGINLGDALTLELTPEAAIPIPSLRGVPYAYLEYRLCAGLRWDLKS